MAASRGACTKLSLTGLTKTVCATFQVAGVKTSVAIGSVTKVAVVEAPTSTVDLGTEVSTTE